MVIKPWGYGIGERIQTIMDAGIKDMGVQNCYFPLFIPLSFFEKEADHVDGFAKEMAVVTHHRLIGDGKGKLIPDPEAKLEEPLRSEEHTSELKSLMRISYAVFCLKKKNKQRLT